MSSEERVIGALGHAWGYNRVRRVPRTIEAERPEQRRREMRVCGVSKEWVVYIFFSVGSPGPRQGHGHQWGSNSGPRDQHVSVSGDGLRGLTG